MANMIAAAGTDYEITETDARDHFPGFITVGAVVGLGVATGGKYDGHEGIVFEAVVDNGDGTTTRTRYMVHRRDDGKRTRRGSAYFEIVR